jgi:hypothetical protein
MNRAIVPYWDDAGLRIESHGADITGRMDNGNNQDAPFLDFVKNPVVLKDSLSHRSFLQFRNHLA